MLNMPGQRFAERRFFQLDVVLVTLRWSVKEYVSISQMEAVYVERTELSNATAKASKLLGVSEARAGLKLMRGSSSLATSSRTSGYAGLLQAGPFRTQPARCANAILSPRTGQPASPSSLGCRPLPTRRHCYSCETGAV